MCLACALFSDLKGLMPMMALYKGNPSCFPFRLCFRFRLPLTFHSCSQLAP